jgi:hypothetical protein
MGESSATTFARNGIGAIWEAIPALKAGSMLCKIMSLSSTQIKDGMVQAKQKWVMKKATDCHKKQGMRSP